MDFPVFFPDYDREDTAGGIGQQRMLTPPKHLILPLSSRGSCCCALNLSFVFGVFEMVDGMLIFFTKTYNYLIK